MTKPNDKALPIYQVADDVVSGLSEGNVVLQAEPGAGKSTGLPLVLLNAGFKAKILMLEPRRLAAQNVATRLASQLNEPLGQTIGLRMRGRTVTSASTRLEVVTEGVLTRILQSDPLLEDVSVVIFDEFHERSLHADLGLALCLDIQQEIRDDLRLLVMSATLDSDLLCSYLGVPAPVRCHVRQHPVDINWLGGGRTPLPQAIAQHALSALQDHSGDILVFLPGVAEIERTSRALADKVPDKVTVHRLHRGVDAKAQTLATEANPDPDKHRRIILSTSIAETSLTIDGVSIVLDSGIERRARFDAASGIERLESVMASKASATQRAGRAGRTRAGVCYRLWSEESHASRAASWQAEMLRSDLSSLLMESGLWGVADVSKLRWIDPPPASAIDSAKSLLSKLGIWRDNALTAHGRSVAALPVEPRIGHMLIWAAARSATAQAATLAAVIEELPRLPHADISSVLATPGAAHRRRSKQLLKVIAGSEQQSAENRIDSAVLLAQAYPDRIAKRRDGRPSSHDVAYQLSGGSGVVLNENDPLVQQEYLVVASLGGSQKEARIFAALPLDIESLLHHSADLSETTDVVRWDDKLERVIAETQLRLGKIVIRSDVISHISPELRAEALLQGIRKRGLQCLNWTDEARQYQARVQRMRALDGDYQAVDDENLLATLEDWLQPYLINVNSLKSLKQLDLMKILPAMQDYQQQQKLSAWLPVKYKVPSGAEHRLRYTDEGNPVLAVKLQEMFGCRENPSIAEGRLPLKVELLSPARRPVQVTEDLANFWHNSYPAVKKDLAGRYPKHPWPDDPLSAEATAYTKHRAKHGNPKPKR